MSVNEALHIITETTPAPFFRINLQKIKTCPKKILQQGLFALLSSYHFKKVLRGAICMIRFVLTLDGFSMNRLIAKS